ncbi:MAG: TetR/AcrR family transcriptional regulator [Spirochaetes bacterium]|nr:TetR/AcrR family transcriptional regulator [Spirochaetota bacterium]
MKARVLSAATTLFMTQGYEKTTIKQIIREAQITTGSLYHFFRNKDDILLHLAMDVFSISAQTADRIRGDEDDPCLRFSLEIAAQLHFILKYEKIAWLYCAAYDSSRISDLIVQMGTARNSELFREYNPEFTDDDYYARTLGVKGILHSFVKELVHSNKLDDHKRITGILEMTLLIYNVPREHIKKTIQKTETIIRKNYDQI